MAEQNPKTDRHDRGTSHAAGTVQGQGNSPGAGTEAPRGASAERVSCLCGCGQTPKGKKAKFLMGHDNRLYGEIKRNLRSDPLLRNERFSDEHREYARERGLL